MPLSAGMMQNKPLGGMPPGMVYIPMGAQAHQQHWPMVQAPWMGHYYIHPGQSLPDHMNIVSSGRSASAPETSLGNNRPARPIQTSGVCTGREELPEDSRQMSYQWAVW